MCCPNKMTLCIHRYIGDVTVSINEAIQVPGAVTVSPNVKEICIWLYHFQPFACLAACIKNLAMQGLSK
jgi:hypothetical protein